MKRYALDSSFMINFLAGKESAAKEVRKLDSTDLIVPAPARMETERGVEDIGSFKDLEVEGFGLQQVEAALRIIEHLKQKGDMIGIIDVMIASIAATK
ncbi:MAG: type II toxin-antitoxin system VapC family toxin, partial [Candidatus Nanohalobium sp.]